MCSELTPCAPIPDSRIAQFMQPCLEPSALRLLISVQIVLLLLGTHSIPCQSKVEPINKLDYLLNINFSIQTFLHSPESPQNKLSKRIRPWSFCNWTVAGKFSHSNWSSEMFEIPIRIWGKQIYALLSHWNWLHWADRTARHGRSSSRSRCKLSVRLDSETIQNKCSFQTNCWDMQF